jgi:hypothetical protein
MLERVDTRHRWLDILPALGVPSRFLRNKHGPCPMCGGSLIEKVRERRKDPLRYDVGPLFSKLEPRAKATTRPSH